MIKITDPKDCCGCTACASVCVHDAITMEPDALGFLYPNVDESKCVDCGLCDKVCQFNDNYDRTLNLGQPVAYAARHKDIDEVMKSRSGAAFVAISDYILEHGGVVYGAGYKDHFRVAHKRATTKEERDEFRGSKYVQSDLTGVFRQVKEDLKNGLTVLFSGTPCQTSGLNAYVGKKLRENLILIDIVCHGVPSPYIWGKYIAYLEKKHDNRIVVVNFRDKNLLGWKEHKESFKYENGKVEINDFYTDLFYQHICFRYSCNICYYANLQHPSDITLADFWGWEKISPEINKDDKGVSLILINTAKGIYLFDSTKEKLEIIPSDIQSILQPNLIKPSPAHSKRDSFEKDYKRFGFLYIMYRYGNVGFVYSIRLIKRRILKILHK